MASRSYPVPVVAVAGRSTLPRNRWGAAADPGLTRQLLTRIGRQIGWAAGYGLGVVADNKQSIVRR
ncbi:hypothetical protein ACFWPH_00165 [Nocardia sp. NPDC058499]|uniref:hypothetical protein n=1 Tax=Nocardia sp. NPDC058499 TaxID=3346530 RepID=UPI00366857FF